MTNSKQQQQQKKQQPLFLVFENDSEVSLICVPTTMNMNLLVVIDYYFTRANKISKHKFRAELINFPIQSAYQIIQLHLFVFLRNVQQLIALPYQV